MRKKVRAGITGARAPRFLLRIPAEMLAHLDQAAQAGHRTRTAEILMRLEASMEGEWFDRHGVMVRMARRSSK